MVDQKSASSLNKSCVALSGGVGGAKLALGLSKVLSRDQLDIIANTGDDFEHIGLYICPDLDTVTYTLADLSNKELGWGQAGETWDFLDALQRLGGESWFRLGDRDMATHVFRTQALNNGLSLSQATEQITQRLGIKHRIIPMCDMPVATKVNVESGKLMAFQHYFVRDRCEPKVTGFEFEGISDASPSLGFKAALTNNNLGSIIICPSNPFVSVDPVLKLPGVMAAIEAANAPTIAVSPIVGGQAIKGPAAKMMKELGMPQTALAVAQHYQGRIDGFVIDEADATMAADIEALGIKTLVTKTMMRSLQDRVDLAEACLTFAESF
ncbi:MAG: 2-phospho-L-lactate transferase [Pseudomonadales bacterium]|nr:2-phospho-L-lactate transferase [Pseudomonadales bacterium]